MVAYVPNPDDASQPTDNVPATTAAAEFRALKGKVNTIQSATGSKVVRQSVLVGPTLAGLPSSAVLSATALGVDLKGAVTAVYLAFAEGFSTGGNNDVVQAVATNLANFWAALAPLNTTYLACDYSSTGNPTAVKTLAPPQYEYSYVPTDAAILQFAGAAASTTFLDDFGNTWTAQGAAKVQNTQFKFGTGALGGGGGANALDGTADFVKSSSFSTKTWDGSWAFRCWTYLTVLPTAGNTFDIASFVNAGGFGAEILVNNTAGTLKFGVNLSSNGSSNDIAAASFGIAVPALNTWYFTELTYDALAGKYKLMVDGVEDVTVTSALKICSTTLASVGAKATGANFMKGYIDKFELLNYCQHPNGVTYTVPTAAPSIAAAGYASDFFSLFDFLLYSPSVASVAAGANPTFITKTRLYVAEADTDALAVTAVRPYAYQGVYSSAFLALPTPAGTATTLAHNIGTSKLKNKRVIAKCVLSDAGYVPGDILDTLSINVGGTIPAPTIWNSRNNAGFNIGSSANTFLTQNKTTGAQATLTRANWQYQLSAERAW